MHERERVNYIACSMAVQQFQLQAVNYRLRQQDIDGPAI